MVILTPPLKGRWEVASLAMNDCGQGHPHPISKKEGGEFAMYLIDHVDISKRRKKCIFKI